MRRNRRLVTLPFIAAGIYLARFETGYAKPGTFLIMAGEFFRIWGSGYLQKEQKLCTGGPYRMIRHPLYLGSLMIAAGFAILSGSVLLWLLIILYFTVCYYPTIVYEEDILAAKFSDDFKRYTAIVPAFYPTLKLYPDPDLSRFSVEQVLKNKEYNAVLGIIVIYAYLVFISVGWS